ncbi:BTAD domain-containing putative transcriptional regulator [Streptomyces boninensis]|uniref:BTAD domain-containing putative transcriptional regulator n=1 Tax=Streptomyces boninensis TaxID=2039455 RepID=UPI003B21F7CD
MRFGVLGPLAVWTDGGVPVKVAEAKVRALLADLLLHEGAAVSADRLIDDVWGEALPANPAATLQTRVWQLRRTLEAAESGGKELVVRGPGGYRLAAGAVDAREFAALADRARTADDPAARAAGLTEALALWRGPAYADLADEEFARAATARLEEHRLAVVEELAEARLALGEHAALVGELGELAARHPLRERLRAALLRALYRSGRQSEALAEYAALRRHLAAELGLEPGPELAALHQAILEQDPALGLAATPPPVTVSAPSPVADLPTPVTELIGRDSELADVQKLLRSERMITLTGPGGVGKTRLALEAARLAADDFPDGVRLAELVGRECCDSPAESIAEALGVRDADGRDTEEVLTKTLRSKRLLLVLDNCEHVVESVARLAGPLLRAAPGLHILATSQEPLAVDGERMYAVPPLAPPEAGDAVDLAELRQSGAVRLFLARAAATAPGFRLDAGNAAAVAAICRRLDGIPLALELAATRVRALGVERLAERLDDRFRLLAAGRRDAPARHRTLRATIEWSWELLAPEERVVLRRLAVHAGGCTLAAAEAVCADAAAAAGSAGDTDGVTVVADDVAELLARLVDRSLVATAPAADGYRYRLLESVGAFGLEELKAAGEETAVRLRHAAYYTALAERTAPQLTTDGQLAALRRLDAESTNLHRALGAAVTTGDAGLALRLAGSLAWYWFLRGRHQEGARSLAWALAAGAREAGGEAATQPGQEPSGQAGTAAQADPAPQPDPAPQAPAALRATVAAWHDGFAMIAATVADGPAPVDTVPAAGADPRAVAFLAYARANYGNPGAAGTSAGTGAGLAARALAEARERGDRWCAGIALAVLSTVAVFSGEIDEAARRAAESTALFEELGEGWGQLEAAEHLARYAEITGDYERAARLHGESMSRAEELGLWADVSYRLTGLGRIALLTGDLPRSRELHERARELAAKHLDPAGEEYATVGLAMLARRDGRPADTEALLAPWLEWNRRLRTPHGLALTLAELGFAAEQRGDLDRARELHLEGLTAARETADPRAVALALEGLAGVEAAAGGAVRAGDAAHAGDAAPAGDAARAGDSAHAARPGSPAPTGDTDPATRAALLLGTAAALRRRSGAPLPPAERGDVDRITALATRALGAPAFAAAHERGAAMHPSEHPIPHSTPRSTIVTGT